MPRQGKDRNTPGEALRINQGDGLSPGQAESDIGEPRPGVALAGTAYTKKEHPPGGNPGATPSPVRFRCYEDINPARSAE